MRLNIPVPMALLLLAFGVVTIFHSVRRMMPVFWKPRVRRFFSNYGERIVLYLFIILLLWAVLMLFWIAFNGGRI